ncbi:hard surface induced [Fusarium sporotrichioides]|uniref:Hard surface induced n=1 Tax=Fusarium sporotrichioides TaxID=5514 RepID=A0A395SR59_FUSSP|nr:hard surface induced [Fusarium sporotrichioides]
MDAFQKNANNHSELVDQAHVILTKNGGQYSLDQAPIVQGAVDIICNHIAGVNGLTKVEYEILMEYNMGLHATEQSLFANALANVIKITRPKGLMTDADNDFLYFTSIVTDTVAEIEMNDTSLANAPLYEYLKIPTTQKTIRADHKKWKCNNNVGGKPCGKINDISSTMCDCGTRRKADTEALAADGSIIGSMYRLNDDLTEDWEYFSPKKHF